MNITMMRLKPVEKELAGIRAVLERIADCMEIELARDGYNVRPPKADVSGPEPTVAYTDEEVDWAKEQFEFLRREDEQLAQEEEESGGTLDVFRGNREQ